MVDMAKSCYIRSIMARESSVRIKVDDFLVFLKDDSLSPLMQGIARMAAINLRQLLASSSNNAELVMKLSERILTPFEQARHVSLLFVPPGYFSCN